MLSGGWRKELKEEMLMSVKGKLNCDELPFTAFSLRVIATNWHLHFLILIGANNG
jgi:hypothetical protein